MIKVDIRRKTRRPQPISHAEMRRFEIDVVPYVIMGFEASLFHGFFNITREYDADVVLRVSKLFFVILVWINLDENEALLSRGPEFGQPVVEIRH
ncbi:MAG: hypothetical protein AAB638_01290, partial [Patescibacteria group bacterium]